MVEPGSRVLDVGCGDGELLNLLRDDARGRRPRHRTVAERRQPMRRQGPFGHSGRRRHRPRRLSRRFLRLRHPVADFAGDPAPARRARTHAAHRQARDRLRAQFRPLARARATRLHRPDAGDAEPFLFLVRHPQHPLLHHRRFRRLGARNRRDDRQERRARSPRQPLAGRLADLGVEPAGRTGGVSAAPQAPERAPD